MPEKRHTKGKKVEFVCTSDRVCAGKWALRMGDETPMQAVCRSLAQKNSSHRDLATGEYDGHVVIVHTDGNYMCVEVSNNQGYLGFADIEIL